MMYEEDSIRREPMSMKLKRKDQCNGWYVGVCFFSGYLFHTVYSAHIIHIDRDRPLMDVKETRQHTIIECHLNQLQTR